MISQPQPFCRLSFRVEGENWNAYYANINTMEGATYLGSVKMALVANPKRRDQFIAFMRDCFGDVTQQAFGHRPEWNEPVAAPDHERTKGSS